MYTLTIVKGNFNAEKHSNDLTTIEYLFIYKSTDGLPKNQNGRNTGYRYHYSRINDH